MESGENKERVPGRGNSWGKNLDAEKAWCIGELKLLQHVDLWPKNIFIQHSKNIYFLFLWYSRKCSRCLGTAISKAEREYFLSLCCISHNSSSWPLLPSASILTLEGRESNCIARATTANLLSKGFEVIENYPPLIGLNGCLESVKTNEAPKMCQVLCWAQAGKR